MQMHIYKYNIYIYKPTMSPFYINVIYVLINQGDIFFKSVMIKDKVMIKDRVLSLLRY